MLFFPSVERLLRLFQNPSWKRAFGLGGRDGSRWQNDSEVWECSLAHFRQSELGELRPLINQPNCGIEGNKPECGNAREKGRDSPLRRAVIMSRAATAIYKMNGCHQPGWCVPRYAFQHCQETAEGPS